MALVDCAGDAGVSTEARAALLAVLSTPGAPHSDALLLWLRAQEAEPPPYWLDLAVLRARAGLGDMSAVRPLAELAADPWRQHGGVGKQSIDTLIEIRGLAAVLAELGADSATSLATSGASVAARLLGLRLQWREGVDVSPSLADASVVVARTAYDLLAGARGDDDALIEMVDQRRPGHLWALAVLHRRGHPIRDVWEALGSPSVDLLDVPLDVRRAIVREYVPGQRETDPRWLVEAACLEPSPDPDERGLLRDAAGALAGAGLEPQAPSL
jgi:hypothetical protein